MLRVPFAGEGICPEPIFRMKSGVCARPGCVYLFILAADASELGSLCRNKDLWLQRRAERHAIEHSAARCGG